MLSKPEYPCFADQLQTDCVKCVSSSCTFLSTPIGPRYGLSRCIGSHVKWRPAGWNLVVSPSNITDCSNWTPELPSTTGDWILAGIGIALWILAMVGILYLFLRGLQRHRMANRIGRWYPLVEFKLNID